VFVVFVACLGAAISGCASHGPAVPQPFPQPGGAAAAAPVPAPSPAPSVFAEGIVATALHFVGTPYRNGGADPDGFDCSGFVQYVFAQQGIAVPRTVDELARSGARVDEVQLQPGDLVFFHTSGRGPTHVGIAIDANRFVHAPSSRGEVRVEPIARPYWAERFVEARRVVMTTAP
jgi:cell wall-associated NlpC family hydrolase